MQRVLLLYPLYVRIGFGTLVLFGMVGNCVGKREESIAIFLLVAIVWVLMRIISDAIDSIRLLYELDAFEVEALFDKNAEKKPENHRDERNDVEQQKQ
jgi:hypothetical protein